MMRGQLVCDDIRELGLFAVHEAGHYAMARRHGAVLGCVSLKEGFHGEVPLAESSMVEADRRLDIAEAGPAAERILMGADSKVIGPDWVLRNDAAIELLNAADDRDQFTMFAEAQANAEAFVRENSDVIRAVACVMARYSNTPGCVPRDELEQARLDPGSVKCVANPREMPQH